MEKGRGIDGSLSLPVYECCPIPGASCALEDIIGPTRAVGFDERELEAFLLGDAELELDDLIARATEEAGQGMEVVDVLAARLDEKPVQEALLKIRRGTRDFWGRVQESDAVREAAAKALAVNPKSWGLILAKLYMGKSLAKEEALGVIARRQDSEGSKVLAWVARHHGLHPEGSWSASLAKTAIWHLGDRRDSTSLDMLLQLATQGGAEIRGAAISSLRRRPEVEARQMIEDRARNDEDRTVRIVASVALG